MYVWLNLSHIPWLFASKIVGRLADQSCHCEKLDVVKWLMLAVTCSVWTCKSGQCRIIVFVLKFILGVAGLLCQYDSQVIDWKHSSPKWPKCVEWNIKLVTSSGAAVTSWCLLPSTCHICFSVKLYCSYCTMMETVTTSVCWCLYLRQLHALKLVSHWYLHLLDEFLTGMSRTQIRKSLNPTMIQVWYRNDVQCLMCAKMI